MALLTVRSAAERLGVGYSTLKHWIYEGRVRTTQTPGGHHRIADAEIDRLTAHHTPPARGGRIPAPGGFIVALSGRNRLRGFVEEVRSDGLLAQVRLRIGDQTLTAIITGDAVRELKLRRGDDAVAIIKSTEVMIAKEQEQPGAAILSALALATTLVGTLHAVDLRNVLTDYTLTSFSRKDGLAGPVWAIAQDGDGFLWLGSDEGLIRFDGVRFLNWD